MRIIYIIIFLLFLFGVYHLYRFWTESGFSVYITSSLFYLFICWFSAIGIAIIFKEEKAQKEEKVQKEEEEKVQKVEKVQKENKIIDDKTSFIFKNPRKIKLENDDLMNEKPGLHYIDLNTIVFRVPEPRQRKKLNQENIKDNAMVSKLLTPTRIVRQNDKISMSI
jgi:hypothetical protein